MSDLRFAASKTDMSSVQFVISILRTWDPYMGHAWSVCVGATDVGVVYQIDDVTRPDVGRWTWCRKRSASAQASETDSADTKMGAVWALLADYWCHNAVHPEPAMTLDEVRDANSDTTG